MIQDRGFGDRWHETGQEGKVSGKLLEVLEESGIGRVWKGCDGWRMDKIA